MQQANIIPNPVTDTHRELQISEWSIEFEAHMRKRLVMGAFRYGKLGEKNKPKYDRVNGISSHLSRYQRDGNLEHLVDIANIALCEFVEGEHPEKHFHSVDDGPHVKLK